MIERVGVVGGGLMGSGIAEVCARGGSDVVVREIDVEEAEAGLQRIRGSLARAVQGGKIQESESSDVLQRIGVTTDLEELADRQLVIEAATEKEEIKREIFSSLDELVTDSEAILASNTSSIPITRIASATNTPERVVGMHFFNPVPVMPLMELVTTVLTDPTIADRAQEYAESLGKTVIRAPDRAGFVVNMLLVPYLLGAIEMYESGVASKEDIDAGMRLGANHPMGPLELTDFVGLDTTKYVADVLFEEFKEPMYAAPPLLTRMVEAGMHGRKTGRGFYVYE